ncbi:hypothetical protein ACHWQZ_G004368 [Mnemiopsis leidyi]
MLEKCQKKKCEDKVETSPPVSTQHVSTLVETREGGTGEETGESRRRLTRQVTNKLLQLKSSREEVQKRTFQKWVNMYLKPRGLHVTDLFTDLQDGVLLLQLLEQLSGQKLGRSRCVDEKLRGLENVDMALSFLHDRGLQLVNIDATNITSGDATLTLGMLWIIILKFQIHGMANGEEENNNNNNNNNHHASSDSPCRVLGSTLQQQLRGWLQETLGTTEQFNFSTSWSNGILLCRLLHAYRPDKVDMASVSKMSPVERVQHALNVAKSCFSVEPLLLPHDLATSIPDERVVLVYLSVLKSVLQNNMTSRQRTTYFRELQEETGVIMTELEAAQEECVEEMAREWRKLRDKLHSHHPPQGLNEVFLVSSRQLASQYAKCNKAAQDKLHGYSAKLQQLDKFQKFEKFEKFEKEIKRLKHLANYVHAYRDSLAKVDIYKHAFPATPPHEKKPGPYVDSDYDIPSISCSATPLHYSRPMNSPATKRRLTRGPSSTSLPSEDDLGLLPEKKNSATKQYDDPDVSKYLRTSLHRGSMCGPPPQGFKDLLLDFEEDDNSCPWQIASVKRNVDEMDLGDVDPEDPVREIIRRRKIALKAREGRNTSPLDSPDSVRLKNKTQEEYYTGSSKVIHQSEEGEITIRSDRKTKLYNKFKKYHLVQSLDDLKEESMLDLLEDNMFVADDEDYVSVSSGSISLFGDEEEEEEELTESFLPLMEHCVSVESLLSDIVELTSNSDLDTAHQNVDFSDTAPIMLSRDYDFEVHKTVVVTEVQHDDPAVQRLFEKPSDNGMSKEQDPVKLEGRTYSSQCTVWLRPDKQRSKSPAGEPKIYSADVTCVYGDNTIVSEVTPGKDMSIFLSPHSPTEQASGSPPRTPLKIDILPAENSFSTPNPDKTVHITYANNADSILSPSLQTFTTKILPREATIVDDAEISLSPHVSELYDSGVGPSLTFAPDSTPNSTSPLDSGFSSPPRNNHESSKTPDPTTTESPITIPDRDRVLTISGSSSEGIERDLRVPSEPLSMIPGNVDLESIPENNEQKTFRHSVSPRKEGRLKRSKSADSPGEIEHDGQEAGSTGDSSDRNIQSILSPPLLSPANLRRRKFTRRRSKGSEILSSDEEVPTCQIGGLSKYISMPRNDLVQAIKEESMSGKKKGNSSPEGEYLTPGVSDTEDQEAIPQVMPTNVKQSESEYSVGEVCYPSPPDSGPEYNSAGDMIFGEYDLPYNDYVAVYEAMLEIYDAAISGKKEMLHKLRKSAAFEEDSPVDKTICSVPDDPGSPPEFEELPRLYLSNCLNKVLTDDYRDRLDILDESLSSDSDGPSTSSSWFTFSSGKSSLRSSFEVHDEPRDLHKMPSVDEEPALHVLKTSLKDKTHSDGVNVYLVDGENAGDLVFGDVDIPHGEFLAEHVATLDRVSDSELIAELVDASLRFWSEDISSESDHRPPDVECFSLDETELAKSSASGARPESSPIPKITIDGIEDGLRCLKKKRRRKKRTKSRSPDFLPFPDTLIDLRLDTKVPTNTPIPPNPPTLSLQHLPSQFLFDKALQEKDSLNLSEDRSEEEKPSSPYPSIDIGDKLHLLLDNPSPVLESLSETEEEDQPIHKIEPSGSRAYLKIHPNIRTQLPPHQEPAHPPLSPVNEVGEFSELDDPDQEFDSALDDQVLSSAEISTNTDSDVPSKPPKPVLTKDQKRRLKKKKLCRTDSEVGDKEVEQGGPNKKPLPPGLPRPRNTSHLNRDPNSFDPQALRSLGTDGDSPSPSPTRITVYLDEDGEVIEGGTAEDLIFEEFDETTQEYVQEMFVEHEVIEEIPARVEGESLTESSPDLMQGFCPTPDEGETTEDLVFEEEEDARELYEGLISVYETVYETLVSNPVDTSDVGVECDLDRPVTADIGTDYIVQNHLSCEGHSQTEEAPNISRSTQSYVDQRDIATSLPRPLQVDSTSQSSNISTQDTFSQVSPDCNSSKIQCGTSSSDLVDLTTQADLKPDSRSAAAQSDIKPHSASFESQCDIRPPSSCIEIQCETASTIEASSQAEIRPVSTDVSEQTEIRPVSADVSEQTEIRPVSSDVSEQTEIRPFSSDVSEQTEIRPVSSDVSEQTEIRPVSADVSEQAEIRPVSSDVSEQTEIRPISADVSEQTEIRPISADVSEQTDIRPISADVSEQTEIRPVSSDVSEQAEILPVCSDVSEQAEIRPVSANVSEQAEIRPVSADVSEQTEIRPVSADVSEQTEIRPVSSDVSEQAEIRPVSSDVSEQAEIRPFSSDVSEQTDIRPDSVCSSSQHDPVTTDNQDTQVDMRPTSQSSGTQISPVQSDSTVQFSPKLSDCASQAVATTIPSSCLYCNSSDASLLESSASDFPYVTMATTQTEEARMGDTDEEVDIWTPGLICVDMEDDDVIVDLDTHLRVESEMDIDPDSPTMATSPRPESITQGTQWEEEEEFFDVREPEESLAESAQVLEEELQSSRSEQVKEGWNRRVEAVLSSPVLVSPTSWLDDQELIIQDLVKESENLDGAPSSKLETLSARQDYLSSLRHDLTRYMELCSEVEVRLGNVSSTLDKHNLWLSNSLDGGLQEQLDITKDLQSDLRTIGENITSVEEFAGKLDQTVVGQTLSSGNLRENFNNLSARVGEKSNYLEVESNKFLKFRQDYNELGTWLQTALSDGSGDTNSDTAEQQGSLQRAQTIYNTYKTRVDELSVLKLKLDNVIAYGRDLLIHLSPSAAKQLTSDLTILHTLWEKLDVEVRSRYSEVSTALEGLLNLQDHTNTFTLWLEELIKTEEKHSPEGGDDFNRHVELYLGYSNQLESKSTDIQTVRQLSHQLMGSLDSSYETFISSQFETCNYRWTQLSEKMSRKSEKCHHLQDLQTSLLGHEVMMSQYDTMLKDLEVQLRTEGYDTGYIVGLPALHEQITASLQLVMALERECGQLQLEDSVCSCGLEISLGTSSSKCRTKCEFLLELLSKHQADMGSHQDDVKLCADLHVDLTRELGDISAGIAAALRDTDISLSDRLNRVKQLGVELDGLLVKRAAANDLALKLFKLASKSDTDTISAQKADLERTWLKVTEESARAGEELEEKVGRLKQFQEKRDELEHWLAGLQGKVEELDPNHIVLPSALQDDIFSIKELGEELKSGEKVLEEVQNIGEILKEEDTSVDYSVELDKLLDTFSLLADSVSAKTGQYEAAVKDWDAFRQGAEESKACVAELKELLQQEDPIGPDLEDNFEEISKQRKLLYDACQGSVVALTNLSKKLVDKAGPDATAILLSELNSVQDEWEDAAEGAAQQEDRHNTALSDWDDFRRKLDDLNCWLEDVQEELSHDIPKITGGKQLQKLNSKQQDLENGIRNREELYEEVCEKGTFYINNCNFPELEQKMDALDTRWKEVEEEIPNRSENINALLSVWQDIDEGTKELKQWLNDAKVAIPAGDELSVHSGCVDDTAADLIRYKNFAEELRERRCNLHDLKAKLQDIEYEENSGELKQLLGVFDELDKNLEGVKDNTLSWRQNLEDSANLWNVVSPGDDSMIAQELNKLRNQQCNLADAVTCLNTKIGEVLNQPQPAPSWCSTLIRWMFALLLAYLVFYTLLLWLSDNGQCPGRSWRWWRQFSPSIGFRTYTPQPH